MRERRFEEALPLRQSALEYWRRTCDAFPSDDHRSRFSIALVEWGDLELARGRRAEAEDYFDRALTIDVSLANKNPQSRTFRDNLIWSYIRFGDLASAANDYAAAARHYVDAHREACALAAARPDCAATLWSLANSHQRLAKLTCCERSLEDLFAHHIRRSVDALQRHRERAVYSEDKLEAISWITFEYSRLLCKQNRHAESDDCCMDLIRDLTAIEPVRVYSTTSPSMLLRAYDRTVRTWAEAGDLDRARQRLTELYASTKATNGDPRTVPLEIWLGVHAPKLCEPHAEPQEVTAAALRRLEERFAAESTWTAKLQHAQWLCDIYLAEPRDSKAIDRARSNLRSLARDCPTDLPFARRSFALLSAYVRRADLENDPDCMRVLAVSDGYTRTIAAALRTMQAPVLKRR